MTVTEAVQTSVANSFSRYINLDDLPSPKHTGFSQLFKKFQRATLSVKALIEVALNVSIARHVPIMDMESIMDMEWKSL